MVKPEEAVGPIAARGHNIRHLQGIYSYLCGMGVHATAAFGGLLGQSHPGKASLSITDAQFWRITAAYLEPFLLAFGAVASSMGWERGKFDEFHQAVLRAVPEDMASGRRASYDARREGGPADSV